MYASAEPINGTISRIEDHGTIVLLVVEQEDGQEVTIPFDHSPFRWMLEGEGVESKELIGREDSYDGDVMSFCT